MKRPIRRSRGAPNSGPLLGSLLASLVGAPQLSGWAPRSLMQLGRFVTLCVVIAGIGISLSQADENNRFAVIRESETQHETKFRTLLESQIELENTAPPNTEQGGAARIEGRSIGQLLPPASILEIFVPYDSVNQSQGFDLSNKSIRSLFGRCVFISEDRFRYNHLAPWKTLIATTDAHEKVDIELMLGGNLGRVRFKDAAPVPFECVE